MKIKKLNGMRMLFLLIISMSLFASVSAIGVMPAGKLVDYESGKTISYDLTVLNNDRREMTVSVFVKNKTYDDYVKIQDQVLYFDAGENSKTTKITFTMMPDLNPGEEIIDLIITEFQTFSQSNSGDTVLATGSVVSQIKIQVPYPGLYAEANMLAINPKPDKQVEFSISIVNQGKETINEAYAIVDIYGPTNEKLGSFKTDTKNNIKSKDGIKLTGFWEGTKNTGLYYARAVVYYDSKKIPLEKTFEVGTKSVEIFDFRTEEYRLGSVAKIIMSLRNTWNQDINEIYGDLEIIDSTNNIVGVLKTITTSIKAYESEDVEVFWDTTGIQTGRYDVNVKLHYDGLESEQKIPVMIDATRISLLDDSISGRVVSEGEGSVSSLLIFIIVFVVILNIGLFIYVRKTIKNRK